MIVADTNLALYFVIQGDRFDAAEKVQRRDGDWVAPPLWASEFRNALATHVRADRLTREEARRAWHLARALVRDVDVGPVAILDAAFARGLSGYDAEFVALADALGVPMITDDKGVLKACPQTAISLDDFGAGTPEDPPDAPGR